MPTHEEYDRAIKETLEDSNDRAVAIVAATLLESQLESAIMRRLIPMSNAHRDALFRDEGSYAFAGKIDLGMSLGLYEHKTKNDLHRIKKIRNEFAHNIERDFGHSTVIKACKELTDYTTTEPLSPEFIASLGKSKDYVASREWRHRYLFAVMHIYTSLFTETEILYQPPGPIVLKG